jgi:hypothetical protein
MEDVFASRKTLEFQSGIMKPLQADWFEQHRYFAALISLLLTSRFLVTSSLSFPKRQLHPN